ncbi:hypothetical protein FKP32DRAFT_209856 [Trametes sanguinea]|nr:hypothetical protein FKP32DRAFT_209856 [Trametes sanguinea]
MRAPVGIVSPGTQGAHCQVQMTLPSSRGYFHDKGSLSDRPTRDENADNSRGQSERPQTRPAFKTSPDTVTARRTNCRVHHRMDHDDNVLVQRAVPCITILIRTPAVRRRRVGGSGCGVFATQNLTARLGPLGAGDGRLQPTEWRRRDAWDAPELGWKIDPRFAALGRFQYQGRVSPRLLLTPSGCGCYRWPFGRALVGGALVQTISA